MKTGVIIGGTGAQGAAVVRHLSSLGIYHLKVITRSIRSEQAKTLGNLPNVTLVESSPAGYDEDSFLLAAEGADFAFVNTDGFSVGEAAEVYWGIRFYELARRAGVKHFVYSSLDNLGEMTQYDPEFRVGHYYGKSRVVDFLKAQPASSTNWSAISSGPYIEMLSENFAPRLAEDGSNYQFLYPMGSGAIAFIVLDDFARYVAYILANADAMSGKELAVATSHSTGDELAKAFTAVTGKPAQYIDVPADDWADAAFAHQRRGADTPIGLQTFSHMGGTSAEKVFFPSTWRQNFKRWWNLWKHSADNTGIIRRDYDMLDTILPDRVKSVEEWMRKVNYTGERKTLLKSYNDQLEERKPQNATTVRASACG